MSISKNSEKPTINDSLRKYELYYENLKTDRKYSIRPPRHIWGSGIFLAVNKFLKDWIGK